MAPTSTTSKIIRDKIGRTTICKHVNCKSTAHGISGRIFCEYGILLEKALDRLAGLEREVAELRNAVKLNSATQIALPTEPKKEIPSMDSSYKKDSAVGKIKAELCLLRLDELVATCRDYGVNHGGSKNELIQKLCDLWNKNGFAWPRFVSRASYLRKNISPPHLPKPSLSTKQTAQNGNVVQPKRATETTSNSYQMVSFVHSFHIDELGASCRDFGMGSKGSKHALVRKLSAVWRRKEAWPKFCTRQQYLRSHGFACSAPARAGRTGADVAGDGLIRQFMNCIGSAASQSIDFLFMRRLPNPGKDPDRS